MILRALLAAMLAGLLGGVFSTAAQALRVTPLILEAEQYENAGANHDHAGAPAHDHGAAASEEPGDEAWAPAEGWERAAYTLMANMLVGVAFSLLLMAAVLLSNQTIDWKSGLVWGLCGFLTFVLAPNLGLPPELPGTAAAALGARQLWWLATVICTASGLAIFAFLRNRLIMVAGVVLIAAPHIYGAPQPASHESLAPADLAVDFAVATIATSFAFWLFLGAALGFLLNRALAAESSA